MHTIKYTTTATKHLADILTPVGIYLRIRDYFRDSVLLESTNMENAENSFSFIGIKAIAGIEVTALDKVQYRLPNDEERVVSCITKKELQDTVEKFMQCFQTDHKEVFPLNVAQSLIGYLSYNAIPLFEDISIQENSDIPNLRFRFYQYIIAINHFKDEMYIIENKMDGIKTERNLLDNLLQRNDIPQFPFQLQGKENSCITDEQYLAIVEKGIAHCKRGDVFQVVLSRKFEQAFHGDEFNVYRQLRSINPSPYLFYFDYGSYRLFGSSPESQLIIDNSEAIIHPIAGTIKRTENMQEDMELAKALSTDAKENAEHTMLVDLARNDLSIFCTDVRVAYYKTLKYYSHLIHLVSEVRGTLQKSISNFYAFGKSFPAGTLSGAPKYKAMTIIDALETEGRGYYGGAIGIMGLDGTCNMAIMIRTFLSKDNQLIYQAGAGIVAASVPQNELQEVNHKIEALRKAIEKADEMYKP